MEAQVQATAVTEVEVNAATIANSNKISSEELAAELLKVYVEEMSLKKFPLQQVILSRPQGHDVSTFIIPIPNEGFVIDDIETSFKCTRKPVSGQMQWVADLKDRTTEKGVFTRHGHKCYATIRRSSESRPGFVGEPPVFNTKLFGSFSVSHDTMSRNSANFVVECFRSTLKLNLECAARTLSRK